MVAVSGLLAAWGYRVEKCSVLDHLPACLPTCLPAWPPTAAVPDRWPTDRKHLAAVVAQGAFGGRAARGAGVSGGS